MSRKRVPWNKIENKSFCMPGWTCSKCSGEGKYIEQIGGYCQETRYEEVYCDCDVGRRLRASKQNGAK